MNIFGPCRTGNIGDVWKPVQPAVSIVGAVDVELTVADWTGAWGPWAPEQLRLRLMASA